MVDCAFCEHPLICMACQVPYQPPSVEEYQAMSQPEETLICPACGEILTCQWCQTPYDGEAGDDDEPAGPSVPGAGA